jgi:transcriptional regulator with PAS, ATPase and Fis domain
MRRDGTEQLIGTSAVIVELSQEIDRIARSDAKVLITGESGVGKELVAHAIHQPSPRASRAMVAVNCAGLPETLLESELFGHVKGSFTGAYRDKQGKLEMADGGSIFLDEIGEMTLRMQGLLLRFMETGELQKVGADRAMGRVNVRVIAATNRNLRDMITEGTFREDLFYRLNVIHLTVPPLRERREDIPSLIDFLLARFTRQKDHTVNKVSEAVVPDDLPMEIRMQQMIALRPKRERRRTVADDLYKKLVEERESFWTVVYPLYMQREITRGNVRDLVRKGLEDARGNYKIVAKLFNMESRDYKRFLNFLRKHDCQLPFKEYRQ